MMSYYPIASMYGIFTHIWLFLMVNNGSHVGEYASPMDGFWVMVHNPEYQGDFNKPRMYSPI